MVYLGMVAIAVVCAFAVVGAGCVGWVFSGGGDSYEG